jgi:hypothetical protein
MIYFLENIKTNQELLKQILIMSQITQCIIFYSKNKKKIQKLETAQFVKSGNFGNTTLKLK